MYIVQVSFTEGWTKGVTLCFVWPVFFRETTYTCIYNLHLHCIPRGQGKEHRVMDLEKGKRT